MLVSLKSGADFSAGCAGERIGHLLLATHPHCLTIRESTSAMARRSKIEQGREYILSAPLGRQRYEMLGHKLVDVVVEAVVYAVEVC